MRKTGLAIALVLGLISEAALASQDVPWPSYRHDAQNSGRADYIGADVSKTKWSFATGDTVSSSPVLGPEGRVYVTSRDGRLYCIDGEGRELWNYDTNATIEYASPALAADGTVYITAYEYGDQSEAQQGLLAINPDGTLKWFYPTTTAPQHSPVVGPDGSIAFGSNGGGLICVRPDGTLRWIYSNYRVFSSPPAFAPDGTIYAAELTGRIHAVNPDGTRKWMAALGGMINHAAAAVGADGTIYQGCSDGKLYAFTPAGALKWTRALGGATYSTPALGDGAIYIAADDGRLHAIGLDGVEIWASPCSQPRSSPAVDYASKVYIGTQLFSAEGALLAALDQAGPTYSCPAVGLEGTVYVSTGNQLLALSTGPVAQPQFNSPPVCSIAAAPMLGRAPLPVAFRAEAGDPDGQVVAAVWDFGDGSGAEGFTAEHTYAAPGSYRAQLTVRDNLGAVAVAECQIDVLAPNQAPAVWASSDVVEGPASLSVNFAAAGEDPENGPMTYVWDFGDGATASGQMVEHTYTKPGDYTARVTVTDDGGLTASAEVAVTVTEPEAEAGPKSKVPGKHLGLKKNGKWLEWLEKWGLRH